MVVTRAPHQSEALRQSLVAKGEVLELPTIRIMPEGSAHFTQRSPRSILFFPRFLGSQNAADCVIDEAVFGVSTTAPSFGKEKTESHLRAPRVGKVSGRSSAPTGTCFGEGVVAVPSRRFGTLAGRRFLCRAAGPRCDRG